MWVLATEPILHFLGLKVGAECNAELDLLLECPPRSHGSNRDSSGLCLETEMFTVASTAVFVCMLSWGDVPIWDCRTGERVAWHTKVRHQWPGLPAIHDGRLLLGANFGPTGRSVRWKCLHGLRKSQWENRLAEQTPSAQKPKQRHVQCGISPTND